MSVGAKSIAGIVFWILFVLSLALNERYRWVDQIWSVTLWFAVLGTLIYFMVESIRHRRVTSTRGYPRWFMRFAYDANEQQQRGKKPVSSLPGNDASTGQPKG
jgi:hypothetical protein